MKPERKSEPKVKATVKAKRPAAKKATARVKTRVERPVQAAGAGRPEGASLGGTEGAASAGARGSRRPLVGPPSRRTPPSTRGLRRAGKNVEVRKFAKAKAKAKAKPRRRPRRRPKPGRQERAEAKPQGRPGCQRPQHPGHRLRPDQRRRLHRRGDRRATGPAATPTSQRSPPTAPTPSAKPGVPPASGHPRWQQRRRHRQGDRTSNGEALTPSLIAEGTAKALDTPVTACARVNADGCTGTGEGPTTTGPTATGPAATPTSQRSPPTAPPSSAIDLRGAVCLRVNGGNCGDATDEGTGNSNGEALIPSVIADGNAKALDTPVTACARINADDCTGTGDGTDGNGTDGNPDLPAIAADSTTVVGNQLRGAVCLRWSGGRTRASCVLRSGPGEAEVVRT